jgi:hypothetical protein
MVYKYKGFDKNGKKVKGTIDAASLDEASAKLRNKNIYYESLNESKEFSLKGLTQKDMPTELLASFSQELASYLQSGMAILTAIVPPIPRLGIPDALKNNRPIRPIATVSPLKKTALPAVAVVIATAVLTSRLFSNSSRKR